MKKLSSIFIAFAVFCFVVLASCQGSGSGAAEEATTEEEVVEEAATEVVEEAADSAAVEGEEMTEETAE